MFNRLQLLFNSIDIGTASNFKCTCITRASVSQRDGRRNFSIDSLHESSDRRQKSTGHCRVLAGHCTRMPTAERYIGCRSIGFNPTRGSTAQHSAQSSGNNARVSRALQQSAQLPSTKRARRIRGHRTHTWGAQRRGVNRFNEGSSASQLETVNVPTKL